MYWNWKQNFARPGVYPGSFLVFWKMNRHHRPLQEFAMRCFELPKNGRVLDIGCGGGYFIAAMLKRAPGTRFYGVDYSPVSVKKSLSFNREAVRRGQVRVVTGSVSSLPFEENFFDLITASETIYFWPDPANDVREAARVLKPGGVFAVCCDAADKEAAKKYTDHIRGMTVYTPEELAGFLSGAGLTGVECHSDPAAGMVCVTGRKPGELQRAACSLGGIPETMLIPLWAKAAESRRPDAIVRDDAAEEILEGLDYDFGKFSESRLSQVGCSVRTVLLDNALKAYLSRNPGAVAVNLGAGLDTRPLRLAGENFSRWIDLDVPEAIALRKQFFPKDGRIEMIGKSILDFSWLEEIRPEGRPVIFIAEGLFMYFAEDDLRRLFDRLAAAFPGSDMLYELVAPVMVKHQDLNDSVGKLDEKPPMLWSMERAADIERWNPAIRFLEEWNYFDFRKKRWGLFGVLARSPLFRKKFACRIVHIRLG